MSVRTGLVARGTLRLGLLLGAVVVVWGAHEAASGSAAHAADREPSGPLTATVGVLTHTVGTVLGLPVSGTDGGGVPPSGSGDVAAVPPAAPSPTPGATSPTLRPVTDPVTVGVLDPLSPVTDLLDPPAAPEPGSPPAPGEPVPGPSDPSVPADPAATPAPAPGRAHDASPPAAGPVLAAPAARAITAVGSRWVDPVRSRAPAAVGPAAHVTTKPALPLPLDGVTHGGGAVHSEPADADANRWRLPALTHGYARPAADPLPPSRTSRPGTRPA
ncbi:hypothetical protein ACFWRG_30745 [Micromonospora tulbaghiae]|uniref:hypothetical protein n=1 Tax=Micromonospora tulbaghiae TaxID=479978 RepID=UPI00364CBCB2